MYQPSLIPLRRSKRWPGEDQLERQFDGRAKATIGAVGNTRTKIWQRFTVKC